MRTGTAIVFLTYTATIGISAQSPTFEVATVKVNHTDSGRSSSPRLTNGRLTADRVTLSQLLQSAYGLSALRITGGPEWLNTDRFDLSGKAPQGVADTELMTMLQLLLKERFQLAVHREAKEMPVYDLVVAKDGLKISIFDPAHPPVPPARNGAESMIIGAGTMSQLADLMTRTAGRPVLDKTGLAGRYGYAMTFSPITTQLPDNTPDPGALDFFAAVKQQLGLRLEAKRETLDILIVDHAERIPAEN